MAEIKALPKSEQEIWKQRFYEDTEKDMDELFLGNPKGIYFRLVDGKNCADKEQMFLANKDGNEDGKHIYYPNVEQKNFEKIPGCRIGYWLSPKIYKIFSDYPCAETQIMLREGIHTGCNEAYLRFWYEVAFSKMFFDAKSPNDIIAPFKGSPDKPGGIKHIAL